MRVIISHTHLQIMRLLPRPLISRDFLSKVSPGFPPNQLLQPAAAASVVGSAIQESLVEEGPHGEYLELLVQVCWCVIEFMCARVL